MTLRKKKTRLSKDPYGLNYPEQPSNHSKILKPLKTCPSNHHCYVIYTGRMFLASQLQVTSSNKLHLKVVNVVITTVATILIKTIMY